MCEKRLRNGGKAEEMDTGSEILRAPGPQVATERFISNRKINVNIN